jgi:hypothetical protein
MNQSNIKRLLVTVLLVITVLSAAFSSPQKTKEKRASIFIFHTDEFWLNLHHFLYVLARAQNKERDASREAVSNAPSDAQQGLTKLSEKERAVWRDVVNWYAAGPAKKDVVFDDPLPDITIALARAGDEKSLAGSNVDSTFVATLERAAPIYRKAWWKQHRDANLKWQKSIRALVNQHGETVLAFITNAYKMEWPTAGFPVHVTAYSNWAGAYSTKANLLVLSSQNPSVQGPYGLETVFHEGIHQWDDQTFEVLREQAVKLNKFFPQGLRHSLIFFTAGEAVRRAIPGHVPYADKYGVWQRGLGPMKSALEESWKPYLDGRGARDEAFTALIDRTAVKPPQ